MCCFFYGGQTTGYGKVSRVLMSIFNIILIVSTLSSAIRLGIANSDTVKYYGVSLIPYIIVCLILMIISSLGSSVICCPNKKVLTIFSILMALFFMAHTGLFIYTIVIFSNENIIEYTVGNYIAPNVIWIVLESALVVLAQLVKKNLGQNSQFIQRQFQYQPRLDLERQKMPYNPPNNIPYNTPYNTPYSSPDNQTINGSTKTTDRY